MSLTSVVEMGASVAEQIRKNAGLVVAIARSQLGADVGYDESGVRWLDGFVQRQQEAGDPSIRDGLASRLAAFLGECVVRTYGGDWAIDEKRNWYVQFDDKNGVFPFAKVMKHLEHGTEDSVLSFFTLIPVLFPRLARQPE